jgi:response regulator of citrate/malate metabolism
MADRPIRTLVVEDDPTAASAHAVYVGRVPGFELAGVVGTGQEALRRLGIDRVDLVLLDMNLPDMHGMELCRTLRSSGSSIDVIAVTSARDLAVVRSAVSQGVVQYILKPFVFASLRDRLVRYAEYRDQVRADRAVDGQQEIDRLMGGLRQPPDSQLPKGLSSQTLETVIAALRSAAIRSSELRSVPAGLAAAEIGESSGMSRVAARRYLEYLHESGLVERRSRFGGSGRPEIEYYWRAT